MPLCCKYGILPERWRGRSIFVRRLLAGRLLPRATQEELLRADYTCITQQQLSFQELVVSAGAQLGSGVAGC